jgi:type IV pilus assembly protein PilM
MIGIDISDRSIKVVQLANDQAHKLLAHHAAALPKEAVDRGVIVEPKMVDAALRDTLKQAGISLRTHDAVVASIPEVQSFLRVIEIPRMNEDEVGEAIQWEIVQHIPFGLENVYVDWQPLTGEGHGAKRDKQEVQAGVAQKKVVGSLYEALSKLELDLAAFELESQALVRSLISADVRDMQGILIVDLGGSVTNVVIHDHGAMRFSATLQKGIEYIASTLDSSSGRAIEEDASQMSQPQEERLITKVLPALEELVIEVNGVVEFYNSIDTRHVVKEIILTGGGSNIPGLSRAFLKHFDNVHIQRGNPWVNIMQGTAAAKLPLSMQESVRYTTALGLALREVLR